MQEEDLFAQLPILCREAMVEAKVVSPGRRVECLCPLQRPLKVALQRPLPSTDAAVYMPSLAHEVQESIDVFRGYQIFDFDDDGTASWLEIEGDCWGVELLQRIRLGLVALPNGKQDAGRSDEQQSNSRTLQRPGQGMVLGHCAPQPTAGGDAANA